MSAWLLALAFALASITAPRAWIGQVLLMIAALFAVIAMIASADLS